ncbi:MAG: squalene/phytoene synthase family protein [Spirulinaceae cyanobacterium]
MKSTIDALTILEQTSRTFFIPISRLPKNLQEAVASAYLCMRAIDEIEDHPHLTNGVKVKLLKQISLGLQEATETEQFDRLSVTLRAETHPLAEVTVRIGEWARLAPPTIAPRIWEATATMADRMAHWANCNWTVNTEAELNAYTFSVAGSVGILLSDLWAWYDGTQTHRTQALGFGRGLQSVNILRNHKEDMQRGVDFFPVNWTEREMQAYARRNLALADAYTMALPSGPALEFCQIPLALAHATLDVLVAGQDKLSRSAVVALVNELIGSN